MNQELEKEIREFIGVSKDSATKELLEKILSAIEKSKCSEICDDSECPHNVSHIADSSCQLFCYFKGKRTVCINLI